MANILHDISPHKYHNEWIETDIQADDLVIIVRDGAMLLLKTGETISYPTYQQSKRFFPKDKPQFRYLFTIDEERFFLAMASEEMIEQPLDAVSFGKRGFLDFDPSYLGFAGLSAWHLAEWYRRNTFCGVCGKQMEHKKDERAMLCPACGFIDYPKISPAIIIGITDGDQLLMTRYANRTYTRHALVAGFTEIGETLEETVRREVMEEVGLQVKDIHYFSSQPWALSESLLIGFFAQVDGSKDITLDTDELSEAVWLKREELTDIEEHPRSLTATMIKAWKMNKI